MKKKYGGSAEFRRALRFVWEGSPVWTAVNAAMVVVQGLMPLLTLYLFKALLDAVTSKKGLVPLSGAGSAAASFDPAHVHRVLMLAIYLAAASAIAAMLNSFGQVVSEVQSQQVADKMQELLHTRSIAADLEYYEDGAFYDALHRAQGDAISRPTRIVNNLVQIAQNAVSLAGIAGLLLFTIHWQYELVILAVTLPGVFVRLVFSRRMYRWQNENTENNRRSFFYNYMLSEPYFAKEVRIYELGGLFKQRARDLRTHLRRTRLALSVQRSIGDASTQGFATACIYAIFGALALAAARGALAVGALGMFFAAFQRGQSALQALLSSFAELYENNLFLGNLYRFLDLEPKLKQPERPKPFPEPIRGGISFDHVSFSYRGSERKVLDDVSLHIQAGETIALVGENGSGKTTLVKLLCRLYDPSQGAISVDGVSLADIDLHELRRQYSVVFQDYARYNFSIRENIWFGDITQPEGDDEAIGRAAERANAREMIARLPRGLDTNLGYTFSEGIELSIGQWQKIALARAFFRDSQIVIMDEPTSALDASAEYEVFESFRRLAAGRTAILISHRLSTVRMADRILVLENGRIAEQGTHEELVRLDGAYARLFELQAKSYVGAFS